VGAIIDRNRTEAGEFSQQFFAIERVEIIRLIGTEVVPDRGIVAGGLASMNLDGDRRWWLGLDWAFDVGLCLGHEHSSGREKRGQKREMDSSKRLLHALHDTIAGPNFVPGMKKPCLNIENMERCSPARAIFGTFQVVRAYNRARGR
jgi:hypothetical protein